MIERPGKFTNQNLLATKAYKTVLDRDRDRRKLPENLRKSLLNP